MKLKNNILSALLILIAGIWASSCNDDNSDKIRAYFIDLVTYDGEEAGMSHFLLHIGSDTPEIDLTAPVTFVNQLDTGQRVLIAYNTPDDQYPTHSTEIDLIQVGYVENGTLAVLPPDSLSNWRENSSYVVAMTRTGKYVNIESRIAAVPGIQRYRLIADETTLNSSTPQLYLVNCTPMSAIQAPSTYFASFNIGSLLQMEHVSGVDIHVANSNLSDKTTFQFKFER